MTTTDWKAAIAANPRDPSLWLQLADFLEESPAAWERETCDCDNGKKSTVLYDDNNPHYRGQMITTCNKCHGSGSLPAMTAHRARLTWWRLMMEDERWHGAEECRECKGRGGSGWTMPDEGGGSRSVCTVCSGTGGVPTFALLFDREERISPIVDQSSIVTIPGHASELAAYLDCAGDGRAEAVREIRVITEEDGRWVVTGENVWFWSLSYAATCREAVRRIVGVFTEECPTCRTDDVHSDCKGPCFGLGWRATEMEDKENLAARHRHWSDCALVRSAKSNQRSCHGMARIRQKCRR
jgi:hypothetical protein